MAQGHGNPLPTTAPGGAHPPPLAAALGVGHTLPVTAVAAAELDGRPVVISGGDDATVRVWDLASGTPVGDPFTGHTGDLRDVAPDELASYCLHALTAVSSLPSQAAVHRLGQVTLAGLHPSC